MTKKKKTTAEGISEGAKQAAAEAQNQMKETATTLAGATHKVLLAGVGAVALSKDEIEDFVARLVERGEIAEQDGRKLVKEVLARRKETTEKTEETAETQKAKMESLINESIEKVLARLNVPSKADIDTLSEKIALLAEKVDALNED